MAKLKKTITQTSIFGEYNKLEDRVTAALLHIIHLGGGIIVQRLFGDVFDIPSNEIEVIPQSHKGLSIPDGELSCDCNYNIFIESKVTPKSIVQKQLNNHKKLSNPASCRYLIYITPDDKKPKELVSADVEWMPWTTVMDRLQGIVADGIACGLLEYLIEQLILLLENKVLKKAYSISKNENVIIVGGLFGERIALKYGFYACQAHRSFRPSKYLAFYHKNRIKYLFEIIKEKDDVDIHKEPSLRTTDYFSVEDPKYIPQLRKFFKLELRTEFIPEILNDKKDKNGKPTAFVQGQTYTSYTKIMKAKKTSDL